VKIPLFHGNPATLWAIDTLRNKYNTVWDDVKMRIEECNNVSALSKGERLGKTKT